MRSIKTHIQCRPPDDYMVLCDPRLSQSWLHLGQGALGALAAAVRVPAVFPARPPVICKARGWRHQVRDLCPFPPLAGLRPRLVLRYSGFLLALHTITSIRSGTRVAPTGAHQRMCVWCAVQYRAL